jgi:hypothetical protein
MRESYLSAAAGRWATCTIRGLRTTSAPQGNFQAALVAATVMAIVVLVFGAWRAVAGTRSDDLLQVWSWIAYWIAERANPYTGVPDVNYPPHAFVVLAWLGLVPKAVAPWLWAVINVGLAPVVAWLFVRDLPLDRGERNLLAAMLLSWGAVLSGLWMGQFTLLSIAAGLVALRRTHRPVVTGALLACALIKPHVGVAFALWMLLKGRWRPLWWAGGFMVAGLIVMAAWARTSPVTIVTSWLSILVMHFGGADPTTGSTAFWSALEPLVGPAAAALLRNWGFAAGVLALAFVLRARQSRAGADQVMLALTCTLVLATLFHRRYDMILLAPAFAALWLVARATNPPASWLFPVLLVVHVTLVAELPWVWRLSMGPDADPATLLDWMALHFDRLLVLTVGVLVLRFRHAIDRAARSAAP